MAGYKVETHSKLPPRAIRCPMCSTRHYQNRTETKRYLEEGFFTVICGCGCKYDVINKGYLSIIRREA